MLLIVAVTYVYALIQSAHAKTQAKLASAGQLAAKAELLLRDRPADVDSAAVLAIESMAHARLFEADFLLRRIDNLLRTRTFTIRQKAAVYAVAMSRDGKVIASGSGDSNARLWDSASGKLLFTLPHGDLVHSVAFSPDGKILASGSYDKTARLWDIATGRLIGSPLTRLSRNQTGLVMMPEWASS